MTRRPEAGGVGWFAAFGKIPEQFFYAIDHKSGLKGFDEHARGARFSRARLVERYQKRRSSSNHRDGAERRKRAS